MGRGFTWGWWIFWHFFSFSRGSIKSHYISKKLKKYSDFLHTLSYVYKQYKRRDNISHLWVEKDFSIITETARWIFSVCRTYVRFGRVKSDFKPQKPGRDEPPLNNSLDELFLFQVALGNENRFLTRYRLTILKNSI